MYSVIIPTYNEAENVAIMCALLDEVFTEMGLEYKIIFVDDSSPDGTYEQIESLKKDYPIIALKRSGKLGLGSAYKHAAQFCTDSDFIVILDADLSQNPLDIKRFIKCQRDNNADVVYATRYSSGGATVNWTFKRRLVSRFANNLTQVVLGIDVTDTTNSFRLYRGKLFRSLLPLIKTEGFFFQTEMIYMAAIKRFKLAECPIIFHERNAGDSKLGPMEIFNYVHSLGRLVTRVDL